MTLAESDELGASTGLVDRFRRTQVGRSILRGPSRVTPRDRAAGHPKS